jgi:hypothetical protein
MGILRQFEKFGQNVKRAFRPQNIQRGFRRFGEFVQKKVLPIGEKVLSGIATGARYAAPVLLASGVGAEFAPIAFGIGAAAGAGAKAIHTGRKILKVAGEGADAFSGKRPDLEKQKKFGRTLTSGALDIGSQFVPGGDVGRGLVRGAFGL